MSCSNKGCASHRPDLEDPAVILQPKGKRLSGTEGL